MNKSTKYTLEEEKSLQEAAEAELLAFSKLTSLLDAIGEAHLGSNEILDQAYDGWRAAADRLDAAQRALYRRLFRPTPDNDNSDDGP